MKEIKPKLNIIISARFLTPHEMAVPQPAPPLPWGEGIYDHLFDEKPKPLPMPKYDIFGIERELYQRDVMFRTKKLSH